MESPRRSRSPNSLSPSSSSSNGSGSALRNLFGSQSSSVQSLSPNGLSPSSSSSNGSAFHNLFGSQSSSARSLSPRSSQFYTPLTPQQTEGELLQFTPQNISPRQASPRSSQFTPQQTEGELLQFTPQNMSPSFAATYSPSSLEGMKERMDQYQPQVGEFLENSRQAFPRQASPRQASPRQASPRQASFKPITGTVQSQVKRVELLGKLARLPRYDLQLILERLRKDGLVNYVGRSSPKIMAETIVDALTNNNAINEYMPLLEGEGLPGSKKQPVSGQVVNRLADMIQREFSPRDIKLIIGELLFYGILNKEPEGSDQQLAKLIARAVAEAGPLLEGRFPDLTDMLKEAEGAGAKEEQNPGAEQAYNYLMTLPISEVRGALKVVSPVYRPGPTKATAAHALINAIAPLPSYQAARIPPPAGHAYDILKGYSVFEIPTRVASPARSKIAQEVSQSYVMPTEPISPKRQTPPRRNKLVTPTAPKKVRYASPQQSYASPQQSYASPKQRYASPQQSYASPQQSYASPKQRYASPQQSYAQFQMPVAPVSPKRYARAY